MFHIFATMADFEMVLSVIDDNLSKNHIIGLNTKIIS